MRRLLISSDQRIRDCSETCVQPALIGSYSDSDRNDIDTTTALIKQNSAFAKCEQGEVFAHADVAAWMPLGSALTSKNIARKNSFATEFFDPAALSG